MNKIKFVDEQGINLNAYRVIKGDGSTEHIKLLREADITQVGTPLNAENLNLVMDDINELDGRVVDIGYLYTSIDDFALRVYNKALTINNETNTNTGRLYIAKVLDNVVVGQYSHDRVFVSIPYENGKYFKKYVYTIVSGKVSKVEDLTSCTKSDLDEILEQNIQTKVTCSHQLEITGNTGDEHGINIADQQMQLLKISGQTIKENNTIKNSKANLVSSGRNLINSTNNIEFGSFTSSNGSATTSTTRLRTINPVKLPKGTYTLSFSGISHYVVYVYDLSGNFLSSESKTNFRLSGSNFTINGNRLVRFAFAKYNNSTGQYDVELTDISQLYNVMLNFGSTALTYESYKEDRVNIGIELGQYDYIDVANSVLVKNTSKEIILNNSNEIVNYGGEWEMSGSSYTDLYRFDLKNLILEDDLALEGDYSYRGEGVCNRLDWTTAGSFDGNVTTNSICFSDKYKIYILLRKDLGVNTLAKFKTWLASNPVKFYYKTLKKEFPISIPNGYAVYEKGLQVQEISSSNLPYIIEKLYSVNAKSQIISNIEVDRGQQRQLNELRSFNRTLVLHNYTIINDGDNINFAKYMQVGVYYGDNRNSTIVNCPTPNQFKMEVFDIASNNARNPETQSWVYRVRVITDLNGEQWVQNPHSGNTIGDFLNISWKQILTSSNISSFFDNGNTGEY